MLWIEVPTVHESLEEFETAVRVYYFIFGKYLIATDTPDITRSYYHYLTSDTEVNAHFFPRRRHSLIWLAVVTQLCYTYCDCMRQGDFFLLRFRNLHVEYTTCIYNGPEVKSRRTNHLPSFCIFSIRITTLYIAICGMGRYVLLQYSNPRS